MERTFILFLPYKNRIRSRYCSSKRGTGRHLTNYREVTPAITELKNVNARGTTEMLNAE